MEIYSYMYDFQAMHRKEGLISSCSGPNFGGFNVSFRKGERVIIMPPPPPPLGALIIGWGVGRPGRHMGGGRGRRSLVGRYGLQQCGMHPTTN